MSKKQLPWLDVVETAKLVRADLKRQGIKARVRTSRFANGTSISIYVKAEVYDKHYPAFWSDYARQWEYGSFDGMTDSYNVDDAHYIDHPTLGKCRSGAKYCSVYKEA